MKFDVRTLFPYEELIYIAGCILNTLYYTVYLIFNFFFLIEYFYLIHNSDLFFLDFRMRQMLHFENTLVFYKGMETFDSVKTSTH